jgi:branched-chain amino acid transport system permease protein
MNPPTDALLNVFDAAKPSESRDPLISSGQTRLKAIGITLAFGGHTVLQEVDLEIASGQIALLRGANGSGKTTLLNVLSGFLRPDSGVATLETTYEALDVLNETPDRLARIGIARLWQDVRLFSSMTVLENVMVASPNAVALNPLSALFQPERIKRQEQTFRTQAMFWLEMVGIADRAGSSGDQLSLGQAKRVAIARALQTGAKVLLLDEPLSGLDSESLPRLVEDLSRIAETTKRAMLIVEHNQEAISPICHLRYTLATGRLTRENLTEGMSTC